MGHLSIRSKLLALFCIAFFTTLAVIGLSLHSLYGLADTGVAEAERLMLDGQKQKLQVATTSMASTLAKAVAEVPDEDAKIQIFRDMISNSFFEEDNSGYFFIYKGTTSVAHPVNAKLHGKDLGSLKGKDGVYSVRELAKAAKAGGGFVNFTWDKPGNEHPVAKLGYATMIPGTQYWIGTGVYIDNIEMQSAEIRRAMQDSTTHAILIQTGAAIALCLFVLLPLSILVSRNIITPIVSTKETAQRIAEGDFETVPPASANDEIGELQHALASMAQALQNNIAAITQKEQEAAKKAQEAELASSVASEANRRAEAKTDELLEAAQQLAEVVDSITLASDHLSEQIGQSGAGAADQADRISTTATAMAQMSATVLEVARNAASAASDADKARTMANDGEQAVRGVVNGMEEVAAQARTLMDDMGHLGKQAENIGAIVNVINDIADQTNLLALNAAIEAARAGDAGRGFAVVADEVRKLAEKTMTATRDVTDAIQNIQEAARTNMNNTVHSVNIITRVTEQANESGQSLRQIVSLVSDAAAQVQSIATAAEQQNAASEEITRSITHINGIAGETSQAMESSQTVLHDMAKLVKTLDTLTVNMRA